jgi:hypothetical protein
MFLAAILVIVEPTMAVSGILAFGKHEWLKREYRRKQFQAGGFADIWKQFSVKTPSRAGNI